MSESTVTATSRALCTTLCSSTQAILEGSLEGTQISAVRAREPKRNRGNTQGSSLPRYYKEVPVKKYVPIFLRQGESKSKSIAASLNGVEIVKVSDVFLRFRSENITVQCNCSFEGKTIPFSTDVNYINDKMRRFLLGNWAYFGLVRARSNFLTMKLEVGPSGTFQFGETSSTSKVGTGFEVEVVPVHWTLRLLGMARVTKVHIHGMVFGEEQGTWIYSGLPGYFIPTLVWT